jgi:hypothetical protein
MLDDSRGVYCNGYRTGSLSKEPSAETSAVSLMMFALAQTIAMLVTHSPIIAVTHNHS